MLPGGQEGSSERMHDGALMPTTGLFGVGGMLALRWSSVRTIIPGLKGSQKQLLYENFWSQNRHPLTWIRSFFSAPKTGPEPGSQLHPQQLAQRPAPAGTRHSPLAEEMPGGREGATSWTVHARKARPQPRNHSRTGGGVGRGAGGGPARRAGTGSGARTDIPSVTELCAFD